MWLWVWLAAWVRSYDARIPVDLPAWLRPVGFVVAIAGALVAGLCIATFVTRGRGTPAPFDPPREFVASGPYRWVRNPMYVGAAAVLFGAGLVRSSPSIVLLTFAFLLAMHLVVILHEEPTLAARFGASYDRYKAAVHRWRIRRPAPPAPEANRAPAVARDTLRCLVCRAEMVGPRRGYWFECRRCGFLASNLAPAIGDDARHDTIDEACRRHALDELRHSNFERALEELERHRTSERPRLLDVGCAHGWFLQAASRRGYAATGLEPDPTIAVQARRAGVSVLPGFFPRDLPSREPFDVISFHDVFEHLPAPREAAEASFERLAPGGLLVLTLPSSQGVLFRLARMFSALGLHGPLDRMWQRGFPSPHLSYFHPAILAEMLQSCGFHEIHRSTLPSFSRRALWQRLRYDRRSSVPTSIAQWLALGALSPLLSILPSDVSLQIFRRGEERVPGRRDVAAPSGSDPAPDAAHQA